MDKNAIYNTKKCLIDNNLGGALKAISPLLEDLTYAQLHEKITKISEDYRLMLNYMRQGYPDPERSTLYKTLLRKLDRVTNEASRLLRIQKDPQIKIYANKSMGFSKSKGEVIQLLENYVSETALLTLEEEDTSEQATKIYQAHYDLMSSLFVEVSYSGQWHQDDQDYYENLVLSPTTDALDAALIVSAISLSSLTYFDIHKYEALANIYKKSKDENTKQRALVGWALTTTRTHFLYPNVTTIVRGMTEDEETMRQLSELQMQIFFCINAERDEAEIKRDIMPNLMKNKGFDITRHGIVEKQEDPMQDILDPEASDRAMEELEKSFERMNEMQRNGSDIYFGGFSQMKRYPFFYTLCNWFCRFDPHHPGLSMTAKKLKSSRFLETLMTKGPFCDSDKYSFALAMSTVIDRIPENMKSMLNDEASFGPIASDDLLSTSSSVRLMYLQDLYRFFKLCDQRIGFYNPFGGAAHQNALFLTYDILSQHIEEKEIIRLGNFLLKRGHYDTLEKLLQRISSFRSPQSNILRGHIHLHQENYEEAYRCFQTAIKEAPTNRRALIGFGRSSLLSEHYDDAAQSYRTLMEAKPDNKNYALNYSIALIKCGKGTEALPVLYKMNYENTDDIDVERILAWCLLTCGKPTQAQNEYKRLLNQEKPKTEDYLNAGYCFWINGNLQKAIESFQLFFKGHPSDHAQDSFKAELNKDKDILINNGISECDIQMMGDLVKEGS